MKLTDNQIIRVKGFSQYANKITIGTARGYALRNGGDTDETHQQCLANGHPTAWAIQSAGALSDDYNGKQADIDAEKAAIAAAVEIEDGQIVEIEGEQFIVKVAGERYSDPVGFKRIA